MPINHLFDTNVAWKFTACHVRQGWNKRSGCACPTIGGIGSSTFYATSSPARQRLMGGRVGDKSKTYFGASSLTIVWIRIQAWDLICSMIYRVFVWNMFDLSCTTSCYATSSSARQRLMGKRVGGQKNNWVQMKELCCLTIVWIGFQTWNLIWLKDMWLFL